jgi:cell division septation protein DedD
MLYVLPKRIFQLLLVTPLILLAGLVLLAPTAIAQTATAQSDQTASQSYPEQPPDDPFKARIIPRNSKIYIAPIKDEDPNKPQAQGFESYLAAALRKRRYRC